MDNKIQMKLSVKSAGPHYFTVWKERNVAKYITWKNSEIM